jgi:hypothetical protein
MPVTSILEVNRTEKQSASGFFIDKERNKQGKHEVDVDS